jgi:hypothetical protein
MEVDKEIKDLLENYSLKQDEGDVDKHFLFGLKEIEHHVPELRELFETKDPHLLDEVADVYIWSKMLLDSYDIGEEIVLKRISRFKEKISENKK